MIKVQREHGLDAHSQHAPFRERCHQVAFPGATPPGRQALGGRVCAGLSSRSARLDVDDRAVRTLSHKLEAERCDERFHLLCGHLRHHRCQGAVGLADLAVATEPPPNHQPTEKPQMQIPLAGLHLAELNITASRTFSRNTDRTTTTLCACTHCLFEYHQCDGKDMCARRDRPGDAMSAEHPPRKADMGKTRRRREGRSDGRRQRR